MKKIILSFSILSFIMSFAQFPIPQNFNFSYDYFELDEVGFCNGEIITGPANCSHFSWESPNINPNNNPILNNYNLYYLPKNAPNPILLKTTTDTNVNMKIGILGKVWVTATYINPEGESEPSNIITNDELPLSTDNLNVLNKTEIYYDNKTHIINIIDHNNISKIEIYNIDGKLIISKDKFNKVINVDFLPNGIYYIVTISKEQKINKLKFIR